MDRNGVAGAAGGAASRPASAELLARLALLHPRKIDLSLGRIERLLAALGSPHESLPPVIHVAGTNGKGSVVAFVVAMLEAAGRRVHSYTSPHLVRFHERIALAGADGSAPITDDRLVDVLLRAEAANGDEPITFFEITTAAAFLAFAETPADFVVLETGLGGRLDATNMVARPAVTAITPVAIDHVDFLGDSLAAIAREKAGILKPGSPCVVARQAPDAWREIEARAEAVGTPLIAAGRDFDTYEQHGRLVYQTADALLDLPLPRLGGRHQIDNAGVALTVTRALLGGQAMAAAAQGLTRAVWPARLERLGPGALYDDVAPGTELWLDGGHNPAAATVLAHAMAEIEERVPRPLHMIVGMLKTKDAAGFLAPFQGLAEWVATVPVPGHEETCHEAARLAELARGAGLAAEPTPSLAAALQQSRQRSAGPVRVLICGSLYLAGHVLAAHAAAKAG